jgi:serine/threonine protein kinase
MVLKVHSPDRLAGDLFFLDGSLLFTAEELSRAPAEVLGRSSHGTSYKATLDNGHVLTVKWLREGLAKNKKDFTREAKRFGGIKHPHVVPMRGYYWGPREHEKLLLSDYVSTGSLACHLYEKSGGVRTHPALTWEQRLQIAIGVANGLTYLHGKQGLAHGNLKASNVLLQGPHLQARVADYSLHRLMTAAGTANHILNAGALGYRSPELAATRKPNLHLQVMFMLWVSSSWSFSLARELVTSCLAILGLSICLTGYASWLLKDDLLIALTEPLLVFIETKNL